MGDGYINNKNGTPRFAVSMCTKEYIKYLKQKLSPFTSNIYKPPIGEKNVQQQYEIRTIVHPDLQQYSEWYDSNEKVYPDKLNITPSTLKHWYVTDGGIYSKYNYPQIRCWNERKNIKKVEEYFKDTPLSVSFSSGTIRFPSSKEEFFDYIGREPLSGFEYKFPNVK
jgi:hypothetical protein